MNNIGQVVKSKNCRSCGACSSICPINSVEMKFRDAEGFYRPVVDEASCVGCGRCLRACPATNQKKTSLMGDFQSIYLAHAADSKVRHHATSGGVVNSLVCYILEKNIVQSVIMTGYDAESPMDASAMLITKKNVDSLRSRPRDFASRYVVVPVLSKLKEVNDMKSIAVVGTPCQINSLNIRGGVSRPECF